MFSVRAEPWYAYGEQHVPEAPERELRLHASIQILDNTSCASLLLCSKYRGEEVDDAAERWTRRSAFNPSIPECCCLDALPARLSMSMRTNIHGFLYHSICCHAIQIPAASSLLFAPGRISGQGLTWLSISDTFIQRFSKSIKAF